MPASRIVTILAFGFIALQLVPAPRSNPPVSMEVPASAAVREVLRRACYDCHSNETRWPWYSHVAPTSWLVTRDVHEARSELNFSEWDRYDPDEQQDLVDMAIEEIEDGEMPLWQYQLIHREATLSAEDLALLSAWAATFFDDTLQ